MTRLSIALVAHPHKCARVGDLWQRTLAQLALAADVRSTFLTSGASEDGNAVATMIETTAPDVVVAAGGDGTVGTVVRALCARPVEATPALAVVPLGTANNFARTLGLRAYRGGGGHAADLAVAAITGGPRRRIDVGRAGSDFFAGSFALGLDAEILALRNRLRQRLGLPDRFTGYPLYLWSCAVSVLRRRPVAARISVDGRSAECTLFNLLVVNTPLYAGEFRFDGDPRLDDGLLDAILCTDRAEYLSTYVAAWRRHLRYRAGRPVVAPRGLQRVRELRVSLASPMPPQVDGELGARRRDFEITAARQRLAVCVPPEGSRRT